MPAKGYLADIADQVIVIVGPTASGKSALALAVAADHDVEIVCMDSMQIYREMQVGTARPTRSEMGGVPHHLYGEASLKQPWSSVHYAQRADQVIRDIVARGRVPLLVGGTGLYMRALFEGLDPLPATPAALRQRLNASAKRRGHGWLYRILKRLDPQGAARLHANDSQRVQRFLEVRILTGESILKIWQRDAENAIQKKPIVVGCEVDRPLLWQRIEKRTRAMLEAGWIEETQALQAAGMIERVYQTGPIGYRLVADFLAGKLDREAMIERISIETRRYAKRQMTWFRKIDYIRWFPFHPNLRYNTKSITDYVWDTRA